MSENFLKINEFTLTHELQAFSGTQAYGALVTTGARALVSVRVSALSAGATVTVSFEDTLTADDSYEVVGSPIMLSAVGSKRASFVDFNKRVQVNVTVSGGTASVKVGLILHDNALDASAAAGSVPSGILTGPYQSFQADYDSSDQMIQFRTYVAAILKDTIDLVYDSRGNLIRGDRT